MGLIAEKSNLHALAMRNGVEPIGASQATVAYTVVADLGNGRVRFTATGHGLKKNQCVYIASGNYAGISRIVNVSDVNHFDLAFVFVATDSGNALKTAYLNGYGFIVRKVPLTIAAISPEDPSVSSVNIIAETADFVVGSEYYGPFNSIRLSAGDIEVVRSPIRANLSYTNR